MDLDDLSAIAPLQLSGELHRQGGLGLTNDSNTLLKSQSGDVIPFVEASSLAGDGFDSIVFPLMPPGLGLRLVEQTAARGGGTDLDIEVIEVQGTEFANPFSGDLDSPPVDIIEFDADGDGRDEIAILFGGLPGGVAVFAVSEDGAPTPIDGFSALVGNNPLTIDAGDMDGDGLDDLLVANSTDNSLSVLLTQEDVDGDLYFTSTTLSVSGGNNQLVTCSAIIDWDGDDELDAVVGIDRVNPEVDDLYQVLHSSCQANS